MGSFEGTHDEYLLLYEVLHRFDAKRHEGSIADLAWLTPINDCIIDWFSECFYFDVIAVRKGSRAFIGTESWHPVGMHIFVNQLPVPD